MTKYHLATAAFAIVFGLVGPATTLKADEPAPAASSAVSEAFGNTIRSTYPDGRTAELWLTPDGAYTAEGRRHDPSNGHWKVKGSKLCLKQSRPVAAPFSYCVDLPSTGMAAGWTGKAYTGEVIQIQLIKGQDKGA